jgi:hypothetical protein
MNAHDLEHTARLLGHSLAEHTLGLFLRREHAIPHECPANVDDARTLAAQFADPDDRERLATAVVRQTLAAWAALVR